MIDDSLFEAYAQDQEQEAQERQNRLSGGAFLQNYEDVKYSGLKPNKDSIIRAVGGPPDSRLDDFTARTVTIARIIGDNGKQFRCIRPASNEDPNYIINKIISAVKRAQWDKQGNKTRPVEEKYPEIYNIVDKNGLAATDKRARFERGWQGRELLIMNVIDRSQMDWHREHKHTMILSRNINVGPDGTEYADEGVPSYGFTNKLAHLFASYGSWEKYDIAIRRTGLKETPYIITNATRIPEEVQKDVRDLISSEDHLSDEEKSWERYDLKKIFPVTSYTKIYNRLKGTIARIDAALGTSFLKELEEGVEKERKEREAQHEGEEDKKDDSSQNAEVSAPAENTPVHEAVTPVSRPVARPVVPAADGSAPGSEMPHYQELTDEQKASITSCKKDPSKGDKYYDVAYSSSDVVYSCPICGTPAPESFDICPSCGEKFA